MSDDTGQLAQALRDLISEAVQAAVERERRTVPPAGGQELPNVPEADFDLCPWCNKKHMRHLMPVKEARHQLGGISHSTFYALVKEGELSLVKIGRRSFVLAEDLDESLRRKRYDPSGRTEAALASSRPTSWQPVTPRGRQD
jgi:excisionase family DNA binding protein